MRIRSIESCRQGGTVRTPAKGDVMRRSCFVKCAHILCASAIFLAAARGAHADAVSSPAPPDRGSAALSLFSLSAGSLAEALPPVKCTWFKGLQRTYRQKFLAPAPIPPALVKNPFLPPAR